MTGHCTSARRRAGARGLAVVVLTVAMLVVTAPVADAQTAVLGPPNPAKLGPVKVGLISESGSEAIGLNSKQVEQGAQMAVDYINQYLNGLGGHKVALVTCGNRSTPAGGQECANDMVDQGVVAVVVPFTGQGPAEVPIITGAGIPFVTASGASPQELSTSGSFAETGGFPAILAAMAQHAKQHGVKKLAFVASDVPSVTAGIKAIGGIAFKKEGVDLAVVPVANGTPDISSQLQSAVDGGADAIGVVGDSTLCTSFLRSYQTLALHVPKYLIGLCSDKSIVKTLGNVLKGSISAPTTGATTGKDAKLYAAIVRKYGGKGMSPDPATTPGVSGAATAYLSFHALVDGLTGDPTAASVLAQLKAAKNVPVFNSPGITMTCDASAIPLTPAICSAQTALGTMDAKGNVKNQKVFDAAPSFKS